MRGKLPSRLLVAIGGNATHPQDIAGTSEEQKEVARLTAEAPLPLLRNVREPVIAHGNGPVPDGAAIEASIDGLLRDSPHHSPCDALAGIATVLRGRRSPDGVAAKSTASAGR